MPKTERRTATYEAAVLEGAERVRNSEVYRRALVELAGRDPQTESALFNDLAKIALEVVERRALEMGYRQLAASGATDRDPVDEFLEEQALFGFAYEDDEDPAPLLEFLARNST
jgi:hypothetical protein